MLQSGKQCPAFQVDPFDLARGSDVVGEALDWAKSRIGAGPVLVYATDTPESVKAVQAQIGAEKAGSLVEDALAAIAYGLVALGVGQLIVAGGETSGAVVKALGINGLRIGPEIDPGVPWTAALGTARREARWRWRSSPATSARPISSSRHGRLHELP